MHSLDINLSNTNCSDIIELLKKIPIPTPEEKDKLPKEIKQVHSVMLDEEGTNRELAEQKIRSQLKITGFRLLSGCNMLLASYLDSVDRMLFKYKQKPVLALEPVSELLSDQYSKYFLSNCVMCKDKGMLMLCLLCGDTICKRACGKIVNDKLYSKQSS